MHRDAAVTRINDGIGFRPDGHSLTEKIILRLQEAQRDLEKGKTLPPFLLEEDFEDTLESGGHTIPLPAGFLRMHDDNQPHYLSTTSDKPIFLKRRFYTDAVLANIRENSEAHAPSVYVIRQSTIDFIVDADQDYDLTFSYYKAGAILDSNIENVWLANASDWLIGMAGERIARDLRDKDGIAIFQAMKTEGRAAVFGEVLAGELEDMPLQMGANQ